MGYIGARFGRLVVTGDGEVRKGARFLECVCDCGKTHCARTANLNSGKTRSCGCFHAERFSQAGTAVTRTHGKAQTPEYKSWSAMLSRCTVETHSRYPFYGGRGIRVCDQWREFTTFLADMGHRPTIEHSIERIDNDGDYTPENCRWATKSEQASNRRSTRSITVDGETKTLTQWAQDKSIPVATLHNRLARGITGEALFRPRYS